MLVSAVSGFAQSWTANYAVTEPTFVALDGGYLYVSNHGDVPNGTSTTPPSNGGTIVKVNLSTGASTVIATRGTGNGQFISPDAIVVDPATHNLFIADRWLDRVQEITNTGTYVMQFGSGTVGATNEMHGPVGLALDSSGAIYVTEHGDTNGTGTPGNMVSKYTISGTTATQVWRKNNGLNVPYSVSYDPTNNRLLISDGFNHQVQVWDTNGTPIGSFPVPAIALGGSLDGSGNFWMGTADGNAGGTQEIAKFNATTGAQLATFGAAGSGNGQFALPFDVAVDGSTNTAYVTDYNNNRVQVLNLAATPPAGSAPSITSSPTASGTVGQSFLFQVTATNSPTSYNNVDALAAGLTLDTTTGAITGIPSAAGTTTTHLTATNASGTSAQFALTITIAAATSGTGTPAAPIGPSITSFDLDGASVVQGVKADMIVTFDSAVSGVDATDFVTNTQGTATATITGVDPISTSSYRVHFNYTDTDGAIQLAIKTSGTGITDTASGNAFRGAGITASPVYGTGTNKAADVTAPTASVTAGTPSGNNVTFTVTFSEPVTGVDASDFFITGTSGTIGTVTGSGTTYTVPVTASGSGTVTLNSVGGATANICDAATNLYGGNSSASATIAGSGGTTSAPTISNQTVTGTQNQALNYQVAASGATSFTVTGGTLPSGLSMSSAGLITGTPTASGTTTVTVQASNTAGNASAQLTFNIAAATSTGTAPTISNQTTTGTQNTALNYQVQATGATSFSIVGGSLPAGLSMSSSGLITGTPTASGTSTVTVKATNATGSAQATITINVAAAGTAPTISDQTATGTAGTALNYQVQASGATSFSVASGTLPSGLTMDSSGLISGTPAASGTSTATIQATNAFGTTQATVTFNIASAPPPPPAGAPAVTSASMSLTAGIPMVYTVQATNSPTSFTLTNGPSGLSISKTGVISGTPFSTGTFNATVTATNAAGTGTGTITFNISASSGGGTVVKKGQTVIFNAPVSTVFVGDTFKLAAQDSSGLPITYAIISGNATLSGDTLLMTGAGPVVIRALQSGNDTYLPASADITITAQKKAQQIQVPTVTKVHTDAGYTFAATTDSGLPITYTVVSGPATVDGNKLTFTGTGTVVVQAQQDGNSQYAATTNTITLTGNPVPRLVNISTRLLVSKNDANGASIAGFWVTGDAPKQMLIRAVGPTLSGYHLNSPLADPTLKLYDASGTVVATNSGWSDDAKIKAAGDGVGAFGLNAGSKDAALLVTLKPGAYTVQVQSSDNSGTVLIEVYDVSANAPVPTKQLINISTRGYVGTGDNVLIAGFAVSGNEPKQLLVRAVGPTLANFNVGGALGDPELTINDASGKPIAENDNWGTAVQVGTETPATAAQVTAADTATGAFALPAGSKDAAVVLTLPPGQYSAVVTGAAGTTGAAMVEVYEIPNP